MKGETKDQRYKMREMKNTQYQKIRGKIRKKSKKYKKNDKKSKNGAHHVKEHA